MSVLEQILEQKREEVARLRSQPGRESLRAATRGVPAPRGFARALRTGPAPRVIAEFKRASPSKGAIRDGADPASIARMYEEAGAVAISVLTDQLFFKGSLDDLCAASNACRLPLLRKDFTIDELQILESRAAGADAVLLIVAALEDGQLCDLLAAAGEEGLDTLVEVHTRDELDRALNAGVELLGINNRDLVSFTTDVEVTRSLLPYTQGRTVVSESGLDDPDLLRQLAAEGAHAFLVGEVLMRAPEPGEALRKLRGSK